MTICETSEQARKLFAYFDEIQNELNKTANTFTEVLYADRASGIDRSGLALFRTGADNRCFRLFSILRECHEVGFIHLIQKMHGFLALISKSDEFLKEADSNQGDVINL